MKGTSSRNWMLTAEQRLMRSTDLAHKMGNQLLTLEFRV